MDTTQLENTPKKSKKGLITGITVAVVVVAAAIGLFVWHEQPGFCNAICHTPMDAYVESYLQDDTTLAAAHAKYNKACLDCHEAHLDEQIAEATAWISGNYAVDENGMLAHRSVVANEAFCATDGCHDFARVTASTENWGGEAGVNPHSSHQTLTNCSMCHTAHSASTFFCNECHSYQVPEGWIDPAQQ